MTLTEFLLARIAEDEAWANACEGLHWEWVGDTTDRPAIPDPLLDEYLNGVDGEGVSLRSVETFPYSSGIPGEGPRFFINTDEVKTVAAGLIVRHDPARVLAECEAKRAAIEAAWRDHVLIDGEWGMCRGQEELEAANDYPGVVTALAAIYASHPDFDSAWLDQ